MGKLSKSARAWLLTGAAILVIGGIIALVAFRPALERVRTLRAEALLEESLEASAAGEHRVAMERAVSASQMRPENHAAIRQAARAALDYGHASAGEWWRRALELPQLDVEPTLRFVDILVARNEVVEAHRILERLAFQEPENAEVAQQRIQNFRALRRYGDARNLAEDFLRRHPNAAGVEAEYFATLLSTPTDEAQEAAARIIRDLAASENPELELLRRAVQVPSEDMGLRLQLTQRLREAPEATRTDRLLALALQLRFELIEWDAVREDVRKAFVLENPEEVAELIAWMNASGLSAQVREDFDLEALQGDEESLRMMLQALLEGPEEALRQVLDLTYASADSNALSLAESLLWRSRALVALGQGEEALATLKRSVDAAESGEFSRIEMFLLDLEQWDVLKKLYERMTEHPRTANVGKRRLLMAHYQLGEERELLRLLEGTSFDEQRTSPSFDALTYYLRILYDRNAVEARRALESLVAQYPAVVDFRILLALNYALENQLQVAHALLAGTPEVPASGPRHVALARAVAARLVDLPGDDGGPSGLATKSLLPKERQLMESTGLMP